MVKIGEMIFEGLAPGKVALERSGSRFGLGYLLDDHPYSNDIKNLEVIITLYHYYN